MTTTKADPAWAQQHPRIFWTKHDLANIRSRMAHPALAHVLAAVRDACGRYLDPFDKDFINTSAGRADMIGDGIWGGTIIGKLDKLILGAMLDDNAAVAEKLAAVIRVLTAQWEPARAYVLSKTEGLEMFPCRERPIMAAQAGLLPLAFDAMHDRLAPADRDAAREFLRTHVAEPFKHYLLDGRELRQLSFGINIAWWDFNSALWSLAAVYDANTPGDDEAMNAAGDAVRRGLHMGVDASGVIGEGPFYGTIDLSAWLMTAEVLARAGVCDLWSEEPLVRRVMEARLYYALPDMKGVFDHGDANRFEAAYFQGQPLLLAARRLGEPALQAMWGRLAEGRVPAPTVHHSVGVLAPALWHDPEQAPSAMGTGNWPLARGGGLYGLCFFRSGWGEDDLAFTLHGAGRESGTFIHQMVDAGHIALAALGEVWCTGRGYGHTNAAFHNLLVPDGKEPADAPGCVGQMWRGGTLRAFAPGRHADYACVDIAWQWQSQWNLRHALVVRGPGVEPYVLVLDNCNQRSDWGIWDWQFQLEADHIATLDQSSLRAVVQGRKNRLELAWAHFREQDFIKPHRLELLTDRSPLPDRPTLDKTGGKGYARLIARLHGYNGVMLAAMIPRRAATPAVKISRIHARYQFGLVIDHGNFTDTVVAAPIDRRILLNGVDAEASIALVRRDAAGKVAFAAAGDSFALAADGAALQRRQGAAAGVFEWVG